MLIQQGYVQIYTGNGKGKTTAAIGLAVRCACGGGRVFIGQFLKGQDSGELRMAELLPDLEIEQFGEPTFVCGKPDPEAFRRAEAGFAQMKEVLLSDRYDLVIFDEINTALELGLLKTERVIALLRERPVHTEVVFTGRGCPEELYDYADLITEMREEKHYYYAGVPARKGIEY